MLQGSSEMSLLATAGNILWFLVQGWMVGLTWWLLGVWVFLVSFGLLLPFSIACWRVGWFAFAPFGRTLVEADEVGLEKVRGTAVANVLWFLLAGLWLGLAHVWLAVCCCMTVVGIPFGWAHIKLAIVALMPLGRRVYPF